MEEATLCYEGTWEELVAHEPEFRGRKLKIMIVPELEVVRPPSTGRRAPSPLELMKLPFAERERILTAQAEKAAYLYEQDSELTGFEAFGPDDLFDEYPEDAFQPTKAR